MTIQLASLIIILALLAYIVFLHIQLVRRNIFIETTLKRLSGIEKSGNMEEMLLLLQEIQKLSQYRSFFPDKLLEESTINFILENEKDTKIFMHYTKYEADARNIIKEGFKFADSFYKTALPVTKDKLDLTIKHNSRKYFGDYLIIICISNDIVNFYSQELEKAGLKDYSYENVLTVKSPLINDNSDNIYQLACQYVKGFVNHRTGEIVRNPGFEPSYNSSSFIRNIETLGNKQHQSF